MRINNKFKLLGVLTALMTSSAAFGVNPSSKVQLLDKVGPNNTVRDIAPTNGAEVNNHATNYAQVNNVSDNFVRDNSNNSSFYGNLISRNTPFGLKLDIGAALPHGNVRSPLTGAKIKQKASPAVGLTASYQVADQFSLSLEGGVIPFIKGSSTVNSEIRGLTSQYVPKEIFFRHIINAANFKAGLIDIIDKLDIDNSIIKNIAYKPALLKAAVPNAKHEDIKNLIDLVIPYVKNNIKIASREVLVNSTLMLGGEFEVVNANDFKVLFGVKGGIASNMLVSHTAISVEWDDAKKTKFTTSVMDKSHKISPAYGAHLSTTYKASDHLNLGLSYGFKDIGKVKRHIDMDKRTRTTKQKVHLITANISYTF